jgi:hypothetical protein
MFDLTLTDNEIALRSCILRPLIKGCFEHIRAFSTEKPCNYDHSLLSTAAEVVDWRMPAFGAKADMVLTHTESVYCPSTAEGPESWDTIDKLSVLRR